MSFWKYLWKALDVRIQMIFISVIALIFFCVFIHDYLYKSIPFFEIWQNWMEASLAFATVMLALFIGYNEKRQDWENTLPKRLNACFDFDGESIFIVKNAPLAGSGDIRQWGQQIGRQMNNGDQLFFNGFRVEEPSLFNDNNNYTMQYNLTVWLSQKPDIEAKTWKYDADGKLIRED